MLAPRGTLAAYVGLTLALGVAACGDGQSEPYPAAGAAAPSTSTSATTEASAADEPTGTAAASGLKLVPVGRFDSPLYVAAAPKDTRRLYVVEQGGRIKVVRAGKTLPQPFLDIRPLVTSGGEQGLLSVAFPPDHATSKLFYVYYTDKQSKQRIVEYRAASPERADPGSARTVLVMDDPESNHNGGEMVFGPDGKLYVGTGDGGGGNDQHGRRGNAQDLGSFLGKLLRIDPRAANGKAYSVPGDNPFVGRGGARPEVWAYGLRNPWRFAFDAKTGDLSIGDVGQDQIEELDSVKGRGKGANFGWRPFEGRRVNFRGEPAPGAVAPVLTKSHDDGWCSITGGQVVRDPKLPALNGSYVYGDFCQGRLRAVKLRGGRATGDRALPLKQIDSLASFGQDAAGRVHVVSLSGAVYRLAAR